MLILLENSFEKDVGINIMFSLMKVLLMIVGDGIIMIEINMDEFFGFM